MRGIENISYMYKIPHNRSDLRKDFKDNLKRKKDNLKKIPLSSLPSNLLIGY